MTENKRRKPYVRPSMEVIKVETTSILAGSLSQTNSISGYDNATDNNGGWFEENATAD